MINLCKENQTGIGEEGAFNVRYVHCGMGRSTFGHVGALKVTRGEYLANFELNCWFKKKKS